VAERRTITARLRASGSLSALAVPNFRLFFTGELVSMVGGWMQSIGQAWLILQLTNSGVALGLTAALQNLPILLFGVWGGVLADRVDNRRLLVVTEAAGLLQALGLGVMVTTGTITPAWVYLFAFSLGVVNAFQFPAINALLYELVDDDELSSAVGLNSVIMSVGRLAGPGLGAVVITVAGVAACCYANAASFFVGIVTLLLLRAGKLRRRRAAAGETVSLRDGLSYVWRNPTLRLALVVVTIVGMLAYNFSVVVGAMVKFEFDAGAGAFAWVQAVGGLGSVIGGVFAASVARPKVRALGLAGIAFGMLMLASALAPSLGPFVVLWFVVGIASAVFMAFDQMVLQHNTEPHYQGRVMGLYTIAWMGTTPVGALLVGVCIDASSARLGVALGAAATLATGLGALVWSARRREPSVSEVPTAGVELRDVMLPGGSVLVTARRPRADDEADDHPER
jgi:MFS family permease